MTATNRLGTGLNLHETFNRKEKRQSGHFLSKRRSANTCSVFIRMQNILFNKKKKKIVLTSKSE